MKNKIINKTKKYIPGSIRSLLRKRISFAEYDRFLREQKNPYYKDPDEYLFKDGKYKLGIIKEGFQYHKSYIAACREMQVSYHLLDISENNWIENFQKSGCDAFLAWPSAHSTILKQMYDDRLRILSKELNRIIFPSWDELWLYENKLRVRDWLIAKKLPAPKTWVFYDRQEALDFVQQSKFPLVYKIYIGASHTGVWIINSLPEAVKIIKRAFSKGIVRRNGDYRDRHWGYVYFQEYLPKIKEWRMIRIGDSYYGYRKEKVGDFHSGSGAWSWLTPPKVLLDFLKSITELGNFTSMDVDIFETEEGDYLVNELQAVFGATTPAEMLCVDGKFGRYVFDEANQEWVFEEGDFSRNMCANARVEYLINHILKKNAV